MKRHAPTGATPRGTEAATDPNPAANLTRMLLWDPAVTDPAWFVALRWTIAAAVYLTLGIGAAWPSVKGSRYPSPRRATRPRRRGRTAA